VNLVEIYGIAESVDGEDALRYIGKAKNTEARLASHARDMVRRHSRFYKWLRLAMQRPEKPYAVVLCVCKEEDWPETEKKLIAQWREYGEPLLNVSAGGNEPPKHLKAVLAENGRRTARLIHDDPVRKAAWKAKQMWGVLTAERRRRRLLVCQP
jgi:hypothetical protein